MVKMRFFCFSFVLFCSYLGGPLRAQRLRAKGKKEQKVPKRTKKGATDPHVLGDLSGIRFLAMRGCSRESKTHSDPHVYTITLQTYALSAMGAPTSPSFIISGLRGIQTDVRTHLYEDLDHVYEDLDYS